MGIYHGEHHEGELTYEQAQELEDFLHELGASAEAFECEDRDTGEPNGKWAVDVRSSIGYQHFIVKWPETPVVSLCRLAELVRRAVVAEAWREVLTEKRG